MALQMSRPTKHPRTGVYRVRVAIPAHLRSITKVQHGVAREFIRSLHTKDPKLAKERAAPVDGGRVGVPRVTGRLGVFAA